MSIATKSTSSVFNDFGIFLDILGGALWTGWWCVLDVVGDHDGLYDDLGGIEGLLEGNNDNNDADDEGADDVMGDDDMEDD